MNRWKRQPVLHPPLLHGPERSRGLLHHGCEVRESWGEAGRVSSFSHEVPVQLLSSRRNSLTSCFHNLAGGKQEPLPRTGQRPVLLLVTDCDSASRLSRE